MPSRQKITWRSWVNVFMAAVVAFLVVATPVAPASAADNQSAGLNADQLKRWNSLDAAGKAKVRDEAIIEDAKTKCTDDFKEQLGVKDRCEEVVRAGLAKAYENVDEFILGKVSETKVCLAIAQGSPSESFAKGCLDMVFAGMKQWQANFFATVGMVLGKIGAGVIAVVKFIVDPKTALDNLANDFKDQSVEGTKQVLNTLTSTTSFEPNSKEYRALWASMAGVGIMVMIVMLIVLFKRYGQGLISDESFMLSMMYYLPGGMLLAILGPGLLGVVQGWSAGLADGTSGWAAGAINNFVTVVAGFGAMQATGWFGSVLAVILFGLLLLGAFGLLFFLLLTPYLAALSGAGFAVLWGLSLVPSMRGRVVKIGSVLITMIFLKPILFLVLGAFFSVVSATPAFKVGTNDLMVNVGTLGATAILMLMIVASPAALFRFMPMLDADSVPGGHGGAAFAGGMAGAAVAGVGRSAADLSARTRARRRASVAQAEQQRVASAAATAAVEKAGGGESKPGGGTAPVGGSRRQLREDKPFQQAGWNVSRQGGSGAAAASGSGTGSSSSASDAGSGGGYGGRPDTSGWSTSSDQPQTQSQFQSGAAGGRGARPAGRRAASAVATGARMASVAATPIKSGLVGTLWTAREAARTARRAATQASATPQSWNNFEGKAPARGKE